jgi:hypothetical protein
MDYGKGSHSVQHMRFDLGDLQHEPRYYASAAYQNGAIQQTVERIIVGEQSWDRRAGDPWKPQPAHEGVVGEIQLLLPHADSISDPSITIESGMVVLRWIDEARDADMTLTVSPDTGIPRKLRQVTRATGVVLTVAYTGWNEPVEINTPQNH